MIYILGNYNIKETISLSLLKVIYLENQIDLDKFDSIIFTSKNGVISIDKIDKRWQTKEIYAISKATKEFIESNFNVKVVFYSKNAYGDEFATHIKELLVNKKVLYPRAKKVASNLIQILQQSNINIIDIITYETECNKSDTKIEKNSAIIFSSPSTVECFFNNFCWDETFIAIAIGNTTAKAIPKEINYYVSPKQNIEETVKFTQEIVSKIKLSLKKK